MNIPKTNKKQNLDKQTEDTKKAGNYTGKKILK